MNNTKRNVLKQSHTYKNIIKAKVTGQDKKSLTKGRLYIRKVLPYGENHNGAERSRNQSERPLS